MLHSPQKVVLIYTVNSAVLWSVGNSWFSLHDVSSCTHHMNMCHHCHKCSYSDYELPRALYTHLMTNWGGGPRTTPHNTHMQHIWTAYLCVQCSFSQNTHAGTVLGAKLDGHIHNPVMAHNDTPITPRWIRMNWEWCKSLLSLCDDLSKMMIIGNSLARHAHSTDSQSIECAGHARSVCGVFRPN